MIYDVTIGEKKYRVELVRSGSAWNCKLDGKEFPLDVAALGGGLLSLLVQGKSYEVRQENTAEGMIIVVGHDRFSAVVQDPRSLRSRAGRDSAGHGPRKITAPMPGKVVRVLAPAGTEVEAGQPVLVIEAMKMQNELKAPRKGKITRLTVGEGAAVEAGQTLAEVE
ncbi:MAG TPA: biotin/lipoyl-containing protein [Candidatus Angelobacter sp.]|nr:biotin/lipoyl-containing protein [Candidatus Angelobacter sp.]